MTKPKRYELYSSELFEMFYNRNRRYGYVGNISPVDCEDRRKHLRHVIAGEGLMRCWGKVQTNDDVTGIPGNPKPKARMTQCPPNQAVRLSAAPFALCKITLGSAMLETRVETATTGKYGNQNKEGSQEESRKEGSQEEICFF